MRRIFILLFTLLFVLSSATNATAAQGLSSTISFNQTVHLLLYSGFGAVTNKSGTSGYPRINSKWNQPRSSGSNPHQGTDFNLVQGDKFVLPYGGSIIYTNSSSGQSATFVVMLDVNGNGLRDDSVWLRVRHTQKDSNISLNTHYPKGTVVATIQDYNGDGNTTTSGDHLHFGVVFDSGVYEQYGPMHQYYNGVGFNNGKHLDLISYVTPNNTGLSFTAYVMDETNVNPQDPHEIKIFHKKSNETVWKRYNVSINSTTNYFVNWSTLGYSTGQSTNIQYIIRVGRFSGINDALTSWTHYNWGFNPAKFERPDPDPDVSSSNPQPAYSTYVLL